eukprot:g1238.t1
MNRRKLASVASLLGDVAQTTVTGAETQGNGATQGQCQSWQKCDFSVGESVYGPFEAGFSSMQDGVIQAQFGCTNPSACYSDGGLDVVTAEATCAKQCAGSLDTLGLPTPIASVTGSQKYYAFVGLCGGHTSTFHFHVRMSCLYDYEQTSSTGHSPKIAAWTGSSGSSSTTGTTTGSPPEATTACSGKAECASCSFTYGGGPRAGESFTGTCSSGVCNSAACSGSSSSSSSSSGIDFYGKWEDTGTLPDLDACGGHFGVTPDSNGQVVYHNHIQEHAPFTAGCYGPNDDNTLVTVQQCRDLYPNECGTYDGTTHPVDDGSGVTKNVPYQAWCPCFDESGLGFGGQGLNTGVNIVERKAITGGSGSSGSSTTTTTYCSSHTCTAQGNVRVSDADTLGCASSGCTDAQCCTTTKCDTYSCQTAGNTRIADAATTSCDATGCSDATCCTAPTCDTYSCQTAGNIRIAAAATTTCDITGCTDSRCCEAAPKCSAYTCSSAAQVLKSNAASITGSTDALCCEAAPLCSSHSCSTTAGLTLISTASSTFNY